jgi:hypothetical protein
MTAPALLRRLLAALALSLGLSAAAFDGIVVDAVSGRGIAQATVTWNGVALTADGDGRFPLAAAADGELAVRAPGYLRRALPVQAQAASVRIALTPFRPKALYLSPYGIGDARLRGEALALIGQTELNALVIDLKGDRSIVPYPSAAYAQAGIGPQQTVTVPDMPALVRQLKGHGLYLIARIVVFKDDRLAHAYPEWAVRDHAGQVWRDREGLAWIDPLRPEAWGLALGVAEEAAALGFEEIQFDYLRFPDAAGLVFAEPNTQQRRVAAIEAFLDAARARLARHNVFIAADVFGYVCWNDNDTQIGQQLESIVSHVDYLSPMLYPSGFTFGIPGHRDAAAAPYEIVHHSLQRALQRTGLSPLRLRPWLQAFRDYAFDRREFDADEVRRQIDAAEALGTGGWMLWNARNRYEPGGLEPEAAWP